MDNRDLLVQRVVESLLDDERLRSQLTDSEARILLAWGEAQAARIVDEAATGEDAEKAQANIDDGTRRLRRVLREINDLTGEKDGLSDADLRQRLTELLQAAGADATRAKEDIEQITVLRNTSSSEEFVVQLTGLLSRHWLAGQGTSGSRASSDRDPGPKHDAQTGTSTLAIAIAILTIVGFVVAAFLFLRPGFGNLTVPPAGQEGGWYEVYFTSPRYPDTPADHKGGLDERLSAFIEGATTSVDMAIYQLDLENVTQALLDAKQRNCTVRIVTDVDILEDPKENPSFSRLQSAGITVVAGNPNAIMHDKFVVVDGKAVWTGSWNFTVNDTYRYNNNGILLRSPELASNYTATFEKMWRDKQFGARRKAGGTIPVLTIDGTTVENYFAPEDGVAEKIVARLTEARQTIDFMAFSFTDDDIGATVLDRAEASVKVRGVFETTGSETQFSEYGPMKAQGLDVLQDGNPYLMHHKVFIVDRKTVMLGSFNFSRNADTSNDENLIILDDSFLADQFTAEFERVYGQAKNPPRKPGE